jgi:MFS family permease
LVLLTAVYGLNIADRFMVSTLIEPIKAELHLSDTAVAFLTGVSLAIFYVTAGIPLSVLADRMNRRNLIALALAAWSGMTMLCGIAKTFAQLVCARILVGVGEAGGTPPSQSLLSDYFPRQSRPFALSIYALGASLGSMLGSTAGFFSDRWGWRTAFFVLGFPGIVLAGIVRATVSEPQRGRLDGGLPPAVYPGLRELWRFVREHAALRHALAGGALYSTWAFGFLWWIPSFLVRSHHMSVGAAGGWVSLMHGAGGTLVLIGTSVLLSRLVTSDARVVPRLLCACCVFGSAPALLTLLFDGTKESLAMLWVFVPLSYAPIGPCFALVQNLVPSHMRAKIVGVFLLMTTLGNLVIAPQLVGILSDVLAPRFGAQSLRFALLPLAAVGLWAGVHFWMCSRSLPRSASRAREPGFSIPRNDTDAI